jgi:hypothetical protein
LRWEGSNEYCEKVHPPGGTSQIQNEDAPGLVQNYDADPNTGNSILGSHHHRRLAQKPVWRPLMWASGRRTQHSGGIIQPTFGVYAELAIWRQQAFDQRLESYHLNILSPHDTWRMYIHMMSLHNIYYPPLHGEYRYHRTCRIIWMDYSFQVPSNQM